MLKQTKLVLALIPMLTAMSASAMSMAPSMPPPMMECVQMEIMSRGATLPKYYSNSWWVEGRANAEYSISLRNSCGQRILAVVSVDGLNVLDGKEASVKQGGYVLNPGQETVISGWRKNMNDVASFYFTYPGDSLSARMGKNTKLGLIGATFFYEKQIVAPAIQYIPVPPPGAVHSHKESMRDSSNSMDAAPSSAPAAEMDMRARSNEASGLSMPMKKASPSLGTGHGRVVEEQAVKTTFDRQEYPFGSTVIKYDTYQNLVNKGIINVPRTDIQNAFPADPQFTPDPPPRYHKHY